MKKIVFFDLDGTLLNEKKKIFSENKDAIKKARENGIEVVICSGRQQSQVRFYQEIAGASKYIITTNGAEIYDTELKEQLFYSAIEEEICNEIYKYVMKKNLFFRIDTKYARYFNQEKNRVMDEVLFNENPDKFFQENIVLQYSVGSINSTDIDELIDYLKKFPSIKIENRYLAKLPEDLLDIINIVNKSVSKGNAIRGLCKYLKINFEDAVAFGDDLNDISMFEAVGYPIAMGNAYTDLKNMAKEIILENTKPGIAEVLNRLIDENEVK